MRKRKKKQWLKKFFAFRNFYKNKLWKISPSEINLIIENSVFEWRKNSEHLDRLQLPKMDNGLLHFKTLFFFGKSTSLLKLFFALKIFFLDIYNGIYSQIKEQFEFIFIYCKKTCLFLKYDFSDQMLIN